jgi:2-polyprenyl-6-methoxyphenol hydroxylase-like FAD-dependent oxidoreductase
MKQIKTTVCIVGGGPAGIMAGLLFARAGVKTTVIEKHADFLRDFRGDTVHPSTMNLMKELGFLEEFLALPHERITTLGAQFGERYFELVDFSYLPYETKFIALMPQWDFLDFLANKASRYDRFELRMNTSCNSLIIEDERIRGITATGPDGDLRIEADLVIGADGRNSTVRQCGSLTVEEFGAPMDVLWMRFSREPADPPQTLGRINDGAFFIMLNRGEYWQCGMIIEKGSLENLKNAGLEEFRKLVLLATPHLQDRILELTSWNDIKLLTVKVDRLKNWYREGLLCIGDSAHAMSPVGGVGINLAIQDAVACANILSGPLLEQNLDLSHLQAFQKRRIYPARMTQRLQVAIHQRIIRPHLQNKTRSNPPFLLKAIKFAPALRAIPAYLIGIGFRPESILMPEY